MVETPFGDETGTQQNSSIPETNEKLGVT
ncbi:uncharacterized protein G2W53_038530 [Senna tora]|uniref:Uncharacterized protein n=1 Tax=Senna tora TaxID=362788 RepID=A0A834SZJ8_9FABA|nr:uncharacterized protein G2W53_038530 [Senna tora]